MTMKNASGGAITTLVVSVVLVAAVATTAAWRASAASLGGAESTLVPVTPVRIMDTRDPLDLGLAGPFVSPAPLDLQVTGPIATSAGVQTIVPPGATGVMLNVTVVAPPAAGFVSIRPADAVGTPQTSNLNFGAGQTVPNAVSVVLPVGGADDGKIEISYDAYGTAGPRTDILVDVTGYLTRTGIADLESRVAALEGGVMASGAVTVPGAAFQIVSPNGGTTNQWYWNNQPGRTGCVNYVGTLLAGPTGYELTYGLQLPVGVVITGFSATIYDVFAPGDARVALLNSSGTASSVLASVSSSGSGGATVVSATLASPERVDAGEYFVLGSDSSTSSTQIGLCGVTVQYAIPPGTSLL
jgi:hypothetical protein